MHVHRKGTHSVTQHGPGSSKGLPGSTRPMFGSTRPMSVIVGYGPGGPKAPGANFRRLCTRLYPFIHVRDICVISVAKHKWKHLGSNVSHNSSWIKRHLTHCPALSKQRANHGQLQKQKNFLNTSRIAW